MRTNKVKRALKQGKAVYGIMAVEFRSPVISQIFAAAGFDFMFIDMEHGAFDTKTMSDMIRAARLAGIVPIVRVSDCQYHLLSRPLDAGAQGVMVPRVETREQVENIVKWVKYPPVGVRGCGVSTGHSDYERVVVRDFIKHANRENLTIIQIESKTAIENIEELVSVEGVDVACMGPNDLSISLGVPGEIDSPIMVEAMDRVVAACKKFGKAAGTHVGSLELLMKWRERGMRLLAWSSDIGVLRSGLEVGLAALKRRQRSKKTGSAVAD